jgi:DNA-directed RNA polymerase beta' subunit
MSEYKAPSKIIGVQFSILSPEEIRKNSVVEVGDGGRTSETVYTQSTKAPEAQEGLNVP